MRRRHCRAQQQKLAKKATMEAIALAQEREESLLEPESPVEAPVLIQAPARLPSNDDLPGTASAALIPGASEPKVASLARETSFAHQQSIISELQAKLSKEISEKEQLLVAKDELQSEKEELAKMLADSEETIEHLRFGGLDPAVAGTVAVGAGAVAAGEILSGLGEQETRSAADEVEHRPVSPMHAGGLFAELALAKSTEPAKPVTEYRDQETASEPIESWIHSIPGLVPAPVVKEKIVEVPVEKIVEVE